MKSMRDISLNAHYIILFRNNRDVSQVSSNNREYRQAFPGRSKFFMNSYKKATEEPFSYLLVDVHPRSSEVQRLPVASPAQRKAILKSATDDQIKTLCEICENLLSGNIPTKKIKKLCSYKIVIRLLAYRSVPISRKRKLFTTNRQVGGFLPLILPGVLSLLGGIAGKAIETQPEVRIENNILGLLHEKETPDDIKAKLLSDLIPKYQRVMQPPPPPKPFEIPPELLTEPELPLTNIPEVPLRIKIYSICYTQDTKKVYIAYFRNTQRC
ncbi:uncharacterized protein TNCV_1351331 [Trichonephila clavipes]|nr:uncharacterized protein TNCV_1351331 [Trichonephila clavipes]